MDLTGISMDPHFNSNSISLLDRGFIVAIAHVREREKTESFGILKEDLNSNNKDISMIFIACSMFF